MTPPRPSPLAPLLACAAIALATLTPSPANALSPDNLVLVTNKNVPESKALADYYAKRRNIPEGRILELNLPTTDEISQADYDTLVIPPARQFLSRPEIAPKAQCLVTFYGVPLKIGPRVTTPAEQEEARQLRTELTALPDQVEAQVQKVEALAKQADPAFTPATGKTLDNLSARTEAAVKPIAAYLDKIADPQARAQFSLLVQQAYGPLVGPAMVQQNRMHELSRIPRLTPEQIEQGHRIRDQLLKMRARFDDLQARRADPRARAELRALVKEHLNPFEYARTLQGMIDSFATQDTDAAFDSELALVNWNMYPRVRSVTNPLYHRLPHSAAATSPPILMTARLDGPQSGTARDIILASLKAEAEGLQGKVVIDAGGHLAIDQKSPTYAQFDQKFTTLRNLLANKTKLQIVYDASREILPPNSVQNAALYCGWYQVRNYTPTCSFAAGAIGYHVASYELVSLRTPGERGWCIGQLTDGIAATLGPVNEPYLTAFPSPEEFFPLLLTGKLTLAEVFWRTTQHASWRMALIGDPLYTPYKSNPALAVADLPEPLRKIIEQPSPTQPGVTPPPR